MNGYELYNIAKKHIGQGGSKARAYCNMTGGAWCNAYVCYVANEGGVKSLFFDGAKETYCPHSIKWCQSHLAQIPLYLAMPMDIIYFDWNANRVPDHIGFVRNRIDTSVIYTHEGNTSGGIVDEKKRKVGYVLGVFRPHFKGSYDISKPLTVDGAFDYSSIAMLQKALGIKVDGILGKDTVKALQKKAGVTPDGAWGKNTSKAVQKMVGTTADGQFGINSVKALQKWINKQVQFKTDGTKTETVKKTTETVKKVETTTTKYTGIIPMGTLKKGSRGTDVKYLQNFLNAFGCNCGTADGDFGDKTFGAVKSFQYKNGLTSDGIWGANSYSKACKVAGQTPNTSVIIGHACSDIDKKAGDSSGKEVKKSNLGYSSSSSSWQNWTYVVRPKKNAEKSADMCLKAIANNNIGYTKNSSKAYGNNSITKLVAGVKYDLSKIKVKTGLSCGDLVSLCYHYAGLSTFYQGTALGFMKAVRNNSNFEVHNYKKGMALYKGDAIVTAHSNGKNNHVVMVVQGGKAK